MRTAGGGRAVLGYQTHYVVDGGRARIILHALTTPGDVRESQPMLDLLWRVRFRWRARPTCAVGDSKYGTVENIIAVEDEGIRAYFPLADTEHRKGPSYPLAAFEYDAERDEYRCPQGQPLRRDRVAWERELVGLRGRPHGLQRLSREGRVHAGEDGPPRAPLAARGVPRPGAGPPRDRVL